VPNTQRRVGQHKDEGDKRSGEYITRVEIMMNQLARNGETLIAGRVVENILRLMTDDFENVVCTIEESKDLSKLMIEELARSLEAHEKQKKK